MLCTIFVSDKITFNRISELLWNKRMTSDGNRDSATIVVR